MSQVQQQIYQEAWNNRAGDHPHPYSTLGSYAEPFAQMARHVYPRDSFLATDLPYDQWHARTHASLLRVLGKTPQRPALAVESDGITEHAGVRIERLRWQLPYGPATEGLFLTPVNAKGKLPGLLALHDHGGFKYFGKEKIVEQPDDATHPALSSIRDKCYGGSCWATRAAQHGYAVLVHDVFPWGSRRIRIEDLHPDLQKPFAKFKPDSEEYVNAYNSWTYPVETEIFKSLCCAGATYTGLVAYEDQVALDYLLRPEIDPTHVACGGLSGGGLRSLVLSGLDNRLAASFVAGFMPTAQATSYGRMLNCHTMMAFLTSMAESLDFPDILSLHAPKPTFVLQCEHDDLFTLSGMQAADRILSAIYRKLGKADRYQCSFYPFKHMLTSPMQDDAFKFLDRWLL